MLSNEISKRYGADGLPPFSVNVHFTGSAGQSFGAFLAQGVSFTLDECLTLQDGILDELCSPLIRAREIDDLVLEQRHNDCDKHPERADLVPAARMTR